MHLTPEHFELMESNDKCVELRLHDEKRATMKIGDCVTFIKEGSKKSFTRTIINILEADSFDSLLDMFETTECIGFPSSEVALRKLAEFYSSADEQKYGVLGIQVSDETK